MSDEKLIANLKAIANHEGMPYDVWLSTIRGAIAKLETPPHHITVTIDTRTHRVVPLIPNTAIIDAFMFERLKQPTGERFVCTDNGFVKIWNAMLAAAPDHGEDKG